jgi:hypothetical protein
MPQIALGQRSVFVYDASVTPSLVVAGCCQFGGTTNSELYMCLNICFQQPRGGEFRLMAEDQSLLPNDGSILQSGSYYVVTASILPSFGCYAETCSRSSKIHPCGVNCGISAASGCLWRSQPCYHAKSTILRLRCVLNIRPQISKTASVREIDVA